MVPENTSSRRVSMAFTMRFSDKVDIDRLDELARQHGLARKDFLELLTLEAVEAGFIPRQAGEGLRAFAPGGGVMTLVRENGYITSGAGNLNEKEQRIFEQVKSLAEKGYWIPAKQTLTETGFSLESITIQK
jgi:hypothetical protein